MARTIAEVGSVAELAGLDDESLMEAIQRHAFAFFWEEGHPHSGLAPDRCRRTPGPADDLVASGGSGFAIMAIIVAAERGWVGHAEAVERLQRMLALLLRARCYHGALPHFLDGASGDTIPFSRKDDGADLVETALLVQGILCARQYFHGSSSAERTLRHMATQLWEEVEWDWFTQGGRPLLYWHWSPYNGWAMDHEIHGWNECLIAYVLAAGAPRHAVDPLAYHRGFASGRDFINGRRYYDIELPLGMPWGGPLFFAHYSFCGIDPRGLSDRYADYWELNSRHVRIHRAHAIANPHGHAGYGEHCWGLTASDDPDGYAAHAPDNDNGTVSPTAALSSMPYAPREALQVARHLLRTWGGRVWGRYGFIDAFNPGRDWFADTWLAIDQGPIVAMIENHRSGLLWELFMGVPEVRTGLARLGFSSPHLPRG